MLSIHKSTITLILFFFVSLHSSLTHAQKAELVRHRVDSDGHPMAVWEKSAANATQSILLVHGRTWSSVPDFDLQVKGENLSLMDGLVEKGYAVYAVDLRGYGKTPRDKTGWVTPDQTATDLANVLSWLAKQKNWSIKPHLFGWSMGSTHSQMLAQRDPDLIASLTLFGYWKDSDMLIPPDSEHHKQGYTKTTPEAAASDFILPGTISQKAIDAYIKLALEYDPIRTDYKNMEQFNELDPSKVITPTLILQGEHDPIGPTEIQAKLYTRLGTAHKQWVTVPGGDHAAFMETPRQYFIDALVSFLKSIPK
jgi:pimeloyl-ACP methyl ester carboxylesterase